MHVAYSLAAGRNGRTEEKLQMLFLKDDQKWIVAKRVIPVLKKREGGGDDEYL
jgi:hypothetical protein